MSHLVRSLEHLLRPRYPATSTDFELSHIHGHIVPFRKWRIVRNSAGARGNHRKRYQALMCKRMYSSRDLRNLSKGHVSSVVTE